MRIFTRTAICMLGLSICVAPLSAWADTPSIQSPAPLIYLADNLDEKDKLGWCIDTEGRGFAEQLQAHSCKPTGGDTQFRYDAESGTIQSVEFAGKCMTLSDAANPELPFGLLDCVEGEVTQQFAYDADKMEISIASEPSLCVVVATTSIAAGPFMSRDLIYLPCANVEDGFKQWVIQN